MGKKNKKKIKWTPLQLEETQRREDERNSRMEQPVDGTQGRRNKFEKGCRFSKTNHMSESNEPRDYIPSMNWMTSSGPQHHNQNYGYPTPHPMYGPLYGLSAVYGSQFPRFFYPTLPTNSYRPLQPIEWFNQRVPSNCQIYYAMMPSPHHMTKANINQAQPCFYNSIQCIPYSSSFAATTNHNQPLEGQPNPYIYPGYCYGPATFNQESHVTLPTGLTTASAGNPDNINNSTANTSSSPKKKRKRKRKRKLHLEESGIEIQELYDEEDALSTSTTLTGEDSITSFEPRTMSEQEKSLLTEMDSKEQDVPAIPEVTGTTTISDISMKDINSNEEDHLMNEPEDSKFLEEVDKILADLNTELPSMPQKEVKVSGEFARQQCQMSREQLPHLPLVGDLFAINLVDDIVNGAIEVAVNTKKISEDYISKSINPEGKLDISHPEVAINLEDLNPTAKSILPEVVPESVEAMPRPSHTTEQISKEDIQQTQSMPSESQKPVTSSGTQEFVQDIGQTLLQAQFTEDGPTSKSDDLLDLDEPSIGITDETPYPFDDLLPEELEDIDDDTDESELRDLISRQDSPLPQEDGLIAEGEEEKLPSQSNVPGIQNDDLIPKPEDFYTPDVSAGRPEERIVQLMNDPERHFRPIDWPDRNGCAEDDELNNEHRERELVTEIVFISETSFMDEGQPIGEEDEDEESHLSEFDADDRFINESVEKEQEVIVHGRISNNSTDSGQIIPKSEVQDKELEFTSSEKEPITELQTESSRDLASEPLVKFLMEPSKGPSSETMIKSLKEPPKEVLAGTTVEKQSESDSKELEVQLMTKPAKNSEPDPAQKPTYLPEEVSSNAQVTGKEAPEEILRSKFVLNEEPEGKELPMNQILETITEQQLEEDNNNSKLPETDLLATSPKENPIEEPPNHQEVANAEDEELLYERYMDIEDHQQFYDPLKYKDYYQICTNLDVPDSPLLVTADGTTPKVHQPIFDAQHPPPKPPRLRPASREGSATKETTVPLPEALLSNTRGEIVVHELDDVSECGSEDVDTIGHRYQTGEGGSGSQKHGYINQLSLAAEFLKTKQDIPFDDEFKPLTDETMAATSSNVQLLQGITSEPRSNRHIYDSYYGTARPIEMEQRVPIGREVSDSGVQSEEDSADEGDDVMRGKKIGGREGGRPTVYGNFGSKAKPLSAVLKGKSDPLCFCCNLM